jgi:hypothetical protein
MMIYKWHDYMMFNDIIMLMIVYESARANYQIMYVWLRTQESSMLCYEIACAPCFYEFNYPTAAWYDDDMIMIMTDWPV